MQCIPNVNLISNIGFGDQATHAVDKTNPVSKMAVESIENITHPKDIYIDEEADLFTILRAFPTPGLPIRIFNKIKSEIKKFKL